MSEDFKVKIFIVTHKDVELPKDNVLVPIIVGSLENPEMLETYFSDREGEGGKYESISDENYWLNEMTAMFWIWKNGKKIFPSMNYVGINHYRRFFCYKGGLFNIYEKPEDKLNEYYIDLKKIHRILNSNDGIIAKEVIEPLSVADIYSVGHISDDIRKFRKIVKEESPEYIDAFDKVFFEKNVFSPFNMMILRWDDFDKYCRWVFPILFKGKEVIVNESRIQMQRRAYISERLFNVWIEKERKNYKKIPIFLYVSSPKRFCGVVKLFLKNVRNMLIWSLYRIGDKKANFVDYDV